MTINEARKIIRSAAEARDCKYRITKTGEVHFYGRMPNTNVDGWFFIDFDPVEAAWYLNASGALETSRSVNMNRY